MLFVQFSFINYLPFSTFNKIVKALSFHVLLNQYWKYFTKSKNNLNTIILNYCENVHNSYSLQFREDWNENVFLSSIKFENSSFPITNCSLPIGLWIIPSQHDGPWKEIQFDSVSYKLFCSQNFNRYVIWMVLSTNPYFCICAVMMSKPLLRKYIYLLFPIKYFN